MSGLSVGVLLLACVVAAACDLRTFRIPNMLTLPLFAAGLVAGAVIGGWAGLGQALLGAGAAFMALIVFYAAGGLGAGDVKLLAAVGAWLGPRMALEVFVASALAAGIYALAIVLATGRARACWEAFQIIGVRLMNFDLTPAPVGLTVHAALERPDRRRRVVPFAAMIAVGLVAVILRHSA
jgi:prepilin peptidase CpaA